MAITWHGSSKPSKRVFCDPSTVSIVGFYVLFKNFIGNFMRKKTFKHPCRDTNGISWPPFWAANLSNDSFTLPEYWVCNVEWVLHLVKTYFSWTSTVYSKTASWTVDSSWGKLFLMCFLHARSSGLKGVALLPTRRIAWVANMRCITSAESLNHAIWIITHPSIHPSIP